MVMEALFNLTFLACLCLHLKLRRSVCSLFFFFFFVSVIMIVLFFSPPLSLLFGVVGLVNKYIGFFQLAQTGWLFFVVVV